VGLVERVSLEQDLGLGLEPFAGVVVLRPEHDVQGVARSGGLVAARLVAVRRQRVPSVDAEPRVDGLVLPHLQRRLLSLQAIRPHSSV